MRTILIFALTMVLISCFLEDTQEESVVKKVDSNKPQMSELVVALSYTSYDEFLGKKAIELLSKDRVAAFFPKYGAMHLDSTCKYWLVRSSLSNDVDQGVLEISTADQEMTNYSMAPLESKQCRKGQTMHALLFLIKDCAQDIDSNDVIQNKFYADPDMGCDPRPFILDTVLIK